MKNIEPGSNRRRWAISFALVALLTAACSLPFPGPPAPVARYEPPKGALLWAQNCTRCHNLRPGSAFTDDQWEVIAHHMRVRANLTQEEHREILRFLKAGN